MFSLLPFIFFLLTPLVAAIPTTSHNTSPKTCKEYTIPLTITSGTYIWGLPNLTTNYDATEFTNNLSRWDANETFHPISGFENTTLNVEISGTFRAPTNGEASTVLIATHGLGFDRTYWDPSIQPEKYSFVDFAIAKSYSVFFYDRLGLSDSSEISGYQTQVSLQVAVLTQLITLTRAGHFSIPPTSIILLGHSFGSTVSNAVLATHPTLVDGVILTGIGYHIPDTSVSFEAWQPRLARLQSPERWRQLDGGWVSWVDVWSNVNTFFKAPFYDQKVVEWAEAHKQPFSLMEVISLSITDVHSPKFTGPVLVMSGEFDLIFCNGNCKSILEPYAKPYFNASKDLEVYVQPGSGHGINLSISRCLLEDRMGYVLM
ncbi:alpha/beta-hydrolase [Acephala macrosclerotiorum]|nr:alpha/beta-hydrolase [Acephala macrosclerotiorum]